jgi:hypothetical protein
MALLTDQVHTDSDGANGVGLQSTTATTGVPALSVSSTADAGALLATSTGTSAAITVDAGSGGDAIDAFGGNGYSAVYAYSAAAGVGVSGYAATGVGVSGVALDEYSYGVYGSGTGIPVYADGSSSTGGYGLYATSTSAAVLAETTGTDPTIGVWGRAEYGGGGSTGVQGTVGHTGDIGVFGHVISSAYGCDGVRGETTGDASYAVYGKVASGTGSYAGYFDGNLHVQGTLSKSAGTFKIDHPLDPANKYLVHSFVESSERKNIYDGVATADANTEIS